MKTKVNTEITKNEYFFERKVMKMNNMNEQMNTTEREEIAQDKLHPCPACESCTKERFPDRCTCFRMCPYYRCWLARIWRMVTAPLRRAPHYRPHQEGGNEA
jgi:hypothetical protein